MVAAYTTRLASTDPGADLLIISRFFLLDRPPVP